MKPSAILFDAVFVVKRGSEKPRAVPPLIWQLFQPLWGHCAAVTQTLP